MHAPLDPPPPPRRDASFLAALAVAACAHAALGAAWLTSNPLDPGDGGTRLAAITVDLVDGAALEVARPSGTTGEATSTAAPAAAAGDATLSPPAVAAIKAPEPTVVDAPTPEASTETPKPPVPATEPPPPAAPRTVEVLADDALTPAEPPPPPSVAPAPRLTTAGSTAGGAVARADTDQSGAAPAASGAAPGVAAAYGLLVARALSRTRPSGRGIGGDVRVAFTVRRDGLPSEVRVIAARGPDRLKAEALDAVRRTRFMPPPADLTERQRTFEVPYQFR